MQKFSHVAVGLCALAATVRATAGDAVTNAAWQRFQARSTTVLTAFTQQARTDLSAKEAGVEEISFSEFLAPAGEGGLEFSARLRSLAGKRVRLVGYMVRQATIRPGVFVLSPQPVTIEAQGACFVMEIPPHAVHVHAAGSQADVRIAYRPGRIAITGMLELGAQREADGGNSFVRLILDAPIGTTVEASKSTAKANGTAPTS